VTFETKEAIVDWLKQQGVSTVLLCAIMTFIGYAVIVLVPQHIAMIKEGYKEVSEIHSQTINKVVESHNNDRQMFVDLLNGRQLVAKP
jgi:inner membrane protein involved in colicin E2 resistance